MPHIGTVTIEDDVRVGALVVVDRATLNETRIGRGTKIDGQCFIAHNCSIGKDVILAGQVGIAGTVTVRSAICHESVASHLHDAVFFCSDPEIAV